MLFLDKMSYPTINCAILGAGVVGLSTAFRLIELQGTKINKCIFKITIIADKFDLETTSDGAGGKKIKKKPLERNKSLVDLVFKT